jgi:hypothetical protein
MSYSWFLDPEVPINSRSFPTQATAFASSSLASSSSSFIASDFGKQEPSLREWSRGNRQVNNLAIVDTDKSALGMAVRERASSLSFHKKDPNAMTTPNKFSLARNTLLKK